MTVYELINIIKRKPEIYVRDGSVKYLRPFIDGFLMGQSVREPSIQRDIYYGFQEYLQHYYKIRTTKAWEDIIRFFATSEKAALENFFEHYEEYKLMCEGEDA